MKRPIILIFFIGIIFPSFLSAVPGEELHFKILETTEASAPEVWQNYVFFTYESDEPVDYVGLVFEHENFTQRHSFFVNSHGVFMYYMEIPQEPVLSYRLIVDGLWMKDPSNPAFETDPYGNALSVLYLPQSAREEVLSYPVVSDQGEVEFRCSAPSGSRVFLAADFAHFDPFLLPMEERERGEFYLTVRLKGGLYGYYFIINGEKTLDSENLYKGRMSVSKEMVNLVQVD